jgi:NAD(P)-dependent dehydrogenase (short-subunit alcohol dehydrogenase family)
MEQQFTDASVIVTGAGSGLGRATSLQFAREGAWVLVTDVDDELGRETLELIEAEGGSGQFLHVDVAQVTDLRRAVATAVDARGRLDVMFNNAGIPMAVVIEEITEDQWQKVIDVNLKGVFFGCKFAIEQMLKQGGGAIVNTASDMGLVAGLPNQPAYITSKGGVVLLTMALAIDYARNNIRVNCVCPCVMETPMVDKFLATQFEKEEDRARVRHDLHGIQPMGRMTTPEEVGNAVLFLASPLASSITGVAFPVDGGFVAR